MFRVSKVLAPLALIAGIATTTTVVLADGDGNQPPFGKGGFGKGGFGKGGFGKGGFGKGGFDKGDDKKGDKKGDKGPPPKKEPAPPKADPQVEAWLATLLTKIADPHDTVRDSARGAVVAVGPVAIPALQKLADGDDPAKAVAARKLIAAIHSHHGGPGGADGDRGGPGRRPGFGGPGGPGGWRGGPGGWRGFGPPGKGPGGPPKKGPGPRRGGREEEDEVEVAPMPRSVAGR
jgi:hypothetical protein